MPKKKFTIEPTMESLLDFLNMPPICLETGNVQRQWTPETDAYLRRYGPTAAFSTLMRGLKGVSAAQVRFRAKELGVKLETNRQPWPKEFPRHLRHLPSMPIDTVPHEWAKGVTTRIDNPELGRGIVSVVVHRSRGHAETTNPEYAHQLHGDE